MKVFFLVQRWNKPSSRYRVLQYLPRLQAAGIEPELAAVSGRPASRWATLIQARRAPVIFIQKKLFHVWELWLLQSRGAKLIYDFDDAIMLRHDPGAGGPSFTRRRQFARMARQASTLLAGNRFLEKKVREAGGSAVYLPTTVDTEKLRPKTEWNFRETVTLGWLGSPSTLLYLEQLMPALEEVGRRFPHVRLKVVCSRFPETAALELIRKNWKEEEEEEDLHSFDIGLAPLAQDLWCEGKCGLKLLQYLACGLPTVASPGGAQKEIIEDGVNGFLAATPKEWVEKLSVLVGDAAQRKEVGLRGRQTVERRYSLQEGAETLLKVIHDAGR